MYNIVALLIFLLLIAVIVLIKRDKLLSQLRIKKSNLIISEVHSKEIPRTLLISLSKYERVLYKNGFTNRVIIEIKEAKNNSRAYYKFYYYNLIESIHAFIMYNPYSKYRKFYYHFESRFESKKRAISANYDMYNPSKIPIHIYFFKHSNNIDIGDLYNIHKKERIIDGEIVLKERLHIDTLLKRAKAQEYTNKARVVKLEKSVNKEKRKKLELKKIKDNISFQKVNFNINKKVIGVLALISLVTLTFFTLNRLPINLKNEKVEKIDSSIITVLDTKEEIKNFNSVVKKYKGLVSKDSQSDNGAIDNFIDKLYNIYQKLGIEIKSLNKDNIKNYFKEIDNYLQNSTIQRDVSTPLKEFNITKSCKLPKELIKTLKWHNGIEEILPNKNLLNYSKIKKQINKGKNYIYLIANRDLTKGLAFNCTKEGIYKRVDNRWQKEYYNLSHLFKVISLAYKQKALYDKDKKLHINMKKYLTIYLNSLSKIDKNRYKKLIDYLKNRAQLYKSRGDKELRLRVIKEIKNINDPSLNSVIKEFLNDKNIEVKKAAIKALNFK